MRLRKEERPQRRHVWKFAVIERVGQPFGELAFAAPLMRQGQQLDHDPAGLPVGKLLHEGVDGSAIFLPGKELVAIDELQERHELLAQLMDDVAKIGHLVGLPSGEARPRGSVIRRVPPTKTSTPSFRHSPRRAFSS
jgi:hypothetical protein